MGLFEDFNQSWDHTRLKDTVNPSTGEVIERRAQHILLFDPATGEPISVLGGNSGPTPVAPTAAIVGSKALSVGPTAIPISSNPTIVKSLLIQSIKPDGTANTGFVFVGTQSTQAYVLKPGDFVGFDAPAGTTLDLNSIYVSSNTAGTQINYLTMG